jgi:N-methylhydantoinase A/oxoprolinase/acetone carboxylase beta subunit
MPVEIVNLRLSARVERRRFRLPKQTGTGGARKGWRDAWDPRAESVCAFEVFDRYRLEAGARLRGPAIIEERESTTLVGPGDAVEVDEYGILHVTLSGSAR